MIFKPQLFQLGPRKTVEPSPGDQIHQFAKDIFNFYEFTNYMAKEWLLSKSHEYHSCQILSKHRLVNCQSIQCLRTHKKKERVHLPLHKDVTKNKLFCQSTNQRSQMYRTYIFTNDKNMVYSHKFSEIFLHRPARVQ